MTAVECVECGGVVTAGSAETQCWREKCDGKGAGQVSGTDTLPAGVTRRVEFKVGDESKYAYFHYRPERNTFAWKFLPPPEGSDPAEETERFQLWRGEYCYGAKPTLQECVAFVDAGDWRNWE